MTPVDIGWVVVVVVIIFNFGSLYNDARYLLYSLGVVGQSETEGWELLDRELSTRDGIRRMRDRIEADAGANAEHA
ncbi:MAG: hypothetical protein Q9207_007660, partial [Kuettlingeria erythrocarpa]